MHHGFIAGILDLMGYIASFFFPLNPDNYLFVEMVIFLVLVLLVSLLILWFGSRISRR